MVFQLPSNIVPGQPFKNPGVTSVAVRPGAGDGGPQSLPVLHFITGSIFSARIQVSLATPPNLIPRCAARLHQ